MADEPPFPYLVLGEPLAVGDKLKFHEEAQRYEVRAVSADGRWAICTRPFKLRNTVIYTIVDLHDEVRGPDNMVFSAGYETAEQIAENMARLEAGDMEVSRRRGLPLRVDRVDRVA